MHHPNRINRATRMEEKHQMKTRFRSFRIGVMAVVLCLSTVALARAEDAPKPDPSGSNTGGIADIVGCICRCTDGRRDQGHGGF